MAKPVRKRCPYKPCGRMIRLTNAGTFYAHKPQKRTYGVEYLGNCPASGRTPESFHVKPKQGGTNDASSAAADAG